MMKKMPAKYRGVFLVFIMLLSSFSSISFVSAVPTGRIGSVKVTGSNGFENLISDNDQITFEIAAKLDTDADLTKNIILYDSASIPSGFFACVSGTDLQTCTLKYPESGKKRFSTKTPKFSILLVDDAGYVVDRKDVSLTVDNRAPQITLFEIGGITDFEGKKISPNGNVYLNFDVADYGYNGDKNTCSGTTLVQFFLGKSADNKMIAECNEECLADSSCAITGKSVSYSHAETGDITVCAKAKDKFEKSSSEVCKTFTVDKTPPAIKKETAKLTDRNNKVISNILPGKLVPAKFSVSIDGADIDLQSITADLSEVNPSLKLVSPTTNSRNGNILTLIWEFDLMPQAEGTKKVLLSVKDIFGNAVDAANSQIDIALGKDDAGPVIKSIQSGTPSADGNIYVSSSVNLAATIEDVTGISPSDIILHIGSKTISASECTGDKTFTCKWNNADIGDLLEDTYEASIGTDSKDILGNAVKDAVTLAVILDKTKPEIKDDISILGKSDSGIGDVLKTGDIIQISAVLEEKNILSAYADFSSVIIGGNKIEIPCEFDEQENIWLCTAETPKIDRTGVIDNAKIKFTFIDGAGNKVEKEEKVSVKQTKDSPKDGQLFEMVILEDYITPIDSSIFISMAQVDYTVPIYFQLNDLGKCSEGAEAVNPVLKCDEFPNKEIFFSQNGNSYSGFAQFHITPQNIAGKESLAIGATNACFVQYNVKCGNVVYKTPEQQLLRANVFVRWDKSTDEENLQDEIDNIKDDVNGGLDKIANGIDKVANLAQGICRTRSGYKATINVISYVGAIFADCNDASAGAAGFFCGSGEASLTQAFKTTSNSYEKISNYFDTMCGFVSCQGKEGKIPILGKTVGVGKAPLCDLYRDTLLGAGGQLGENTILGKSLGTTTDADGNDVKITRGTVLAGLQQSNLEFAKKNWVFAIGCACLPGMAANIQNYRQMKCEKAVCYRDVIPTGLQTKTDCDREFRLNKCKYFTGSTIGGLTDILIQPFKALGNAFENPFATVWVLGRKGFRDVCDKDSSLGTQAVRWHGSCIPYSTMLTLETLAQTVDTWVNVKDSLKAKSTTINGQPDFCEILNKEPSDNSGSAGQSNQGNAQAADTGAAANAGTA